MRKRKTSLISIREVCDINLTPMMDLTFILLITFIITFPMIEQGGITVDLPSAKSTMKNKDKGRDITIDAQGNIFLDKQPVTKEELAQAMRASPEAIVYVRADHSVDYGRVAEVAGILTEAKVEKMGLITQAEE
ncbi:MAG: biopolymer transporter ExbD [Pontiellaceae bacterium]|jgi:biopolymer transport protein ExbD|nr:biopolymer transporter ExbD [Pontiellaceae bacterium]